ncbi:hypothetical protein F2Q68_00021244 [Brassica cretica]|uniref:Uncharacterized protein n=1 Tax=Brassica cretica TaxID=69181 RepID=A0A8S9FZD0_BRACR|nr:hypothetical protein F2Q68_00021244 [Brassica cretica]
MHGFVSYRRFGKVRSLRSDRAVCVLGYYVATELGWSSVDFAQVVRRSSPPFERRKIAVDRPSLAVARSLRSDRAWLVRGPMAILELVRGRFGYVSIASGQSVFSGSIEIRTRFYRKALFSTGRTLRRRKERVAKHLKRGAIDKETESFLKRVFRIPLHKPFEEAYYTHRLWMFFRETREKEEDIRRMFCEAREKMRVRITLKKKSNPGQFAIPCTMKGIEFPHASCDAGASVGILPRVMADHLGLQVEPSQELFTFVDCSQKNSGGIVRDLEVQIGNALVPVDFHVLDIVKLKLLSTTSESFLVNSIEFLPTPGRTTASGSPLEGTPVPRIPARRNPGSPLWSFPCPVPGSPPSSEKWKTSDKENLPWGDPGTGPGKLHSGEPGFLIAGILGTGVPSSEDPKTGVLPGTRGITCPLKSTGVAYSQQASLRQDIAPVIPQSRVPLRSVPYSEPGGRSVFPTSDRGLVLFGPLILVEDGELWASDGILETMEPGDLTFPEEELA